MDEKARRHQGTEARREQADSHSVPSCLGACVPLSPPIKVPLVVIPEHACPYLPGRLSQSRAFAAEEFPPELYHRFMDAGFRRSGTVFYQPICRKCRLCVPIRVPVERFRPSKSQRRCWRKNQDLITAIDRPVPTTEKYELYQRYLAARHRGPMNSDSRESFESFLYESPVDTLELCYRDSAGRLLAVGICDICSQSLSTVYFYFDPADSRRSLGTFGALVEIETARRLGIPYYYLGFWVAGCRAMEYKQDFRPCEILQPDGTWREMGRGGMTEPGGE